MIKLLHVLSLDTITPEVLKEINSLLETLSFVPNKRWLPSDDMKKLAIKVLKDDRPVWFGCHVSQRFNGDVGVMDESQYDYKGMLGIDFSLDKADRLRYGESLMTHAMVFTGVHLDGDGQSVRWRVENSWGKDRGKDGYLLMTDGWFDEFNYQIYLEKKEIPFPVGVHVTKNILDDFRNAMRGQLGFNRPNWEQAANWSSNNGGDLNEALQWIGAARQGNFFHA